MADKTNKITKDKRQLFVLAILVIGGGGYLVLKYFLDISFANTPRTDYFEIALEFGGGIPFGILIAGLSIFVFILRRSNKNKFNENFSMLADILSFSPLSSKTVAQYEGRKIECEKFAWPMAHAWAIMLRMEPLVSPPEPQTRITLTSQQPTPNTELANGKVVYTISMLALAFRSKKLSKKDFQAILDELLSATESVETRWKAEKTL